MEVTREIRRYGDFSLPGVVLAAAWRAVKISKSVFRPCTLSHPWGGVYTPKSLVWGPFNPPLTSYRPAFDPTGVLWVVAYVHPWGHMSHMRSYGVPGVKKSIFWLLLEIVLGWSEWPKNAQNGLKNRFYGSTMAPQGAQTSEI